jgi:hypothetical protein
MYKRYLRNGLAFIAALTLIIGLSAPAAAQKGGEPTPTTAPADDKGSAPPSPTPESILGPPPTPTQPPTPEGNGGNATWEVIDMGFQSRYPNGFTLTIEATSTGGRLAAAAALWRYSPSSRTRRGGEIDESGTRAVVNWDKTPSDSVPQWVGVEYWWVLQDEAGNVYETERRFAEYEDNTRRWNRAESEDIIIFWEEGVPDEIGPATIEAMRQASELYARYWPRPLGYRPRAIIFANFSTWGEWSPGAGTTTGGVVVAGTTRDAWGATVQIYDTRWVDVEETAYTLVPHEVAHLYQYANSAAVGDFWFVEGNATFFELIDRDRMLNRVRGMATAGTLPSLQGGGPSARGAFARDAYDIGFAFFVWFDEVHGAEGHRQLMALIQTGRSWRDALRDVTGMGFVEMETMFRTWLGAANPVAPTPIPSPTFFFPPTPTFAPTPTPRS